MSEVKMQDAYRVLRREFGFRLDESRARGHERMAAAVAVALGVDHETADDAIYALEHADVLRYVHGESADEGAPLPQGLPRGATAPAPVMPRMNASDETDAGHWRIGEMG